MKSTESKKIYTIEIDNPPYTGVWYSKHFGEQFEAELKSRGYHDHAGFLVGGVKFVHPVHCKVIAEKIVLLKD